MLEINDMEAETKRELAETETLLIKVMVKIEEVENELRAEVEAASHAGVH